MSVYNDTLNKLYYWHSVIHFGVGLVGFHLLIGKEGIFLRLARHDRLRGLKLSDVLMENLGNLLLRVIDLRDPGGSTALVMMDEEPWIGTFPQKVDYDVKMARFGRLHQSRFARYGAGIKQHTFSLLLLIFRHVCGEMHLFVCLHYELHAGEVSRAGRVMEARAMQIVNSVKVRMSFVHLLQHLDVFIFVSLRGMYMPALVIGEAADQREQRNSHISEWEVYVEAALELRINILVV